MSVSTQTSLAQYTTLGLGGPARRLIEVHNDGELISAIAATDAAHEPLLVLAGGSNVVISDQGFPGTVVLIRSRGIQRMASTSLHVAAGENFDALVAYSIEHELSGLECLSGIPGSVGATPIQNVGAYGQEVSNIISSVRVYDRAEKHISELTPRECEFSYRNSLFKNSARYVVLSVRYALTSSSYSSALRYGELTKILGATENVPTRQVREAVLKLRKGKGMVLDPHDADTRSVGSFFTNPVLDPKKFATLSGEIPHWDQPDGTVKVPAAWLIEQSGFTKGYGFDGVAISSKHTLALTNQHQGSTSALLKLAREIREGVRAKFGVTLVNEPVLVGEQL
ncbi:MAG: UDP-N-acetylmuramate dehydrogenase [Corynebacteriales bacterium]|nr:UDP-N-acetylmuramate dehydrogenase [Mycobacteriales bacterium]